MFTEMQQGEIFILCNFIYITHEYLYFSQGTLIYPLEIYASMC